MKINDFILCLRNLYLSKNSRILFLFIYLNNFQDYFQELLYHTVSK